MADVSPSAIGDYEKCPRCFWLGRRKKTKWPRGIFPSLPGGIDRRLKDHYDRYRKDGILPPEIEGKFGMTAKLYPDQAAVDSWRNWRKHDLQYECKKTGGKLGGALDDLIQFEDGTVAPLDYKTRGAPVNSMSHTYYVTQLNCYGLMLSEGKPGLELSGKGYLVFYSPASVWAPEKSEATSQATIEFLTEMVPMDIDTEEAKRLTADTINCLQGDLPALNPDCEQCGYVVDRAVALDMLNEHGEEAANAGK